MSEGPIKAWRDAWKPPQASTNPRTATHALSDRPGGAYCGRSIVAHLTRDPAVVTCSDCLAALRADGKETP